MTFIITLIALVVERFFHWGQLRNWRWFGKYQRWIATTRASNWPSWLLLGASILPALALVWVIDIILSGWFYGILKLIFGVLVLMYCLGPKNFWVQAYNCISELNREDPKIALEKIDAAFHIGTPDNSQAFHQALVRAMFRENYQRVFAVVFWFVLLGPVGAVLYRMLMLSTQDSPLGLHQTAAQAVSVLDWVPVRLFTFIFALAGHFAAVFQSWKKTVWSGVSMNETLLANCGIAALAVSASNQLPETGEAEKETLNLLDRAYVMSLVILAVFVLVV